MRAQLRSPFVWLPTGFFLRDVAAWIYVFSYEPGITEKAVRIHHFLLIPGVFYSVQWSTPINVAFGFVLALALRIAAKHRFALTFTLAVLVWDFILTGLLDFASIGTESKHDWYYFGMMPGRFVSHILAQHKVLPNGQLLYTTILVCNVAAALLVTAAYYRWRPTARLSDSGR
jgi:hypothetical protein